MQRHGRKLENSNKHCIIIWANKFAPQVAKGMVKNELTGVDAFGGVGMKQEAGNKLLDSVKEVKLSQIQHYTLDKSLQWGAQALFLKAYMVFPSRFLQQDYYHTINKTVFRTCQMFSPHKAPLPLAKYHSRTWG